MSPKSLPVFYSCDKCPAYCCSYPRIQVTRGDLRRLARRFDIGVGAARRRFTDAGPDDGERVLRHRPDDIYGTVCGFLDQRTRQCSIYASRPAICRDFPGSVRCGYYDFLAFERRLLEDPEYVSTTFNFEGSGLRPPDWDSEV
jgi:Fe-S-cluster containining protein